MLATDKTQRTVSYQQETHPLENLFLPDITESSIQILDLGNDISDLSLVAALDPAGLADGHVDLETDVTGRFAGREVCGRRGNIGGSEADTVVTAVGSAEGETADGGTALGNDAVVVVEHLVDGDVDAHVWVGFVLLCRVIVLGGRVVAYDDC